MSCYVCRTVITSKKSFEINILIHFASKMSRRLPWPSFHERSGNVNSSNRIELRGEFVKSKSALMLQCGRSATKWTDESETYINNTVVTVRIYNKGESCFFENQTLFSSPTRTMLPFFWLLNFRPFSTIFCREGRRARSMKSKKCCACKN